MRLAIRAALLGVLAFNLPAQRSLALDRATVSRAIDRGVNALRKLQSGGTWTGAEIGMTALAGLTLLECGAAADDKAVVRAAEKVREQCPGLNTTYSIALAILFLDRLGDAADLPLMDALSLRLVLGQLKEGGWCYKCPIPEGDVEVNRLQTYQKKRPDKPRARPARRTADDVSKEVRDQIARIRTGDLKVAPPDGAPDNSNTQFAVLALWIARRNGLPVDDAINKEAAYFRSRQSEDGGWVYTSILGGMAKSTASMTCAGILGLSVAYGSASEIIREKAVSDKLKIAEDLALRRGLAALSSCIDHPASARRAIAPKATDQAFYFLWSLERVAVILDLETIGGKDWYTWGAEILLVSQQTDGSWAGKYGVADTCFALLFLQRANLAPDLTASLKPHLNNKAELRSGGLGGKKLVEEKQAGKIQGSIPIDSRGDPEKTSGHDSESQALARALLEAPSSRQDGLLEKMRDGKGTLYTEGLALAIPQLTGAGKRKAREALSDRLSRMTVETLGKYLKDPDAEIRRAAAWACACKESKVHVPQLIELLNDREATVAFTAHAALREITGQKFAFDPQASATEKTKSIALWKQWWAKHQGGE
jgi:hypothetical protein